MSTQEQNTPRLLPVKFINDAVKAADRMFPNAYQGKMFEFFGPHPYNANAIFTDEVPETGKMPPIYRLQMSNGQWNLMV